MANMIDQVMTAPAWEAEMGKSTIYKTIYDAAESAGIDPKEFLQLAQMESGFKTTAESPQGYRGLFQLNPMDKDIRTYTGSNLPFTSPGLYDPDVNVQFATKRFKSLGDDKIPFLTKAIKYNQGKRGGGEILAAHSSGKSIREELLDPVNLARRISENSDYTPAPWNRTKKVLNNLSDKSLDILARKHGLKGNRKQLINLMVGNKDNQKHLVEDDPQVVSLYIEEQERKISKSSDIVDKILKEM